MKEQSEKLADENRILKEQCQHVESQLDIALVQVNNMYLELNRENITLISNEICLT